MTTCHELDTDLGRYLAGSLPEPDALRLEEHAGDCAHCGAILEMATRLPVRLPTEVPPPPTLRAATLAAVSRRRGRLRVARWLVPPAIAATMMLGFALTRPGDETATGRAQGSESPLAMAVSRAQPEFRAIESARSEVERAMERADPAERSRLDWALRRIARQHDALVRLVREFES
jgi:hypothetical protein